MRRSESPFAKRVIRAAEDQANTACGNIQLGAGLEARIEGATDAVGQRGLERVRQKQQEWEEAGDSVEKDESRGGGGAP